MSYLQKSKFIQKFANIVDDLSSNNELVSHSVIQNQIKVPLPEPCFLKEIISNSNRTESSPIWSLIIMSDKQNWMRVEHKSNLS